NQSLYSSFLIKKEQSLAIHCPKYLYLYLS
ncbi:MAG: hypothetical protein ACI9XO_004723, partial [Paraglaciecola sp.]